MNMRIFILLASGFYSMLALAVNVSVNFTGKVLAGANCTVNDTALSVILPDVYTSEFSGVGTTSSVSQPFNVSLNCTGNSAALPMISVKFVPGSFGAYDTAKGVLNYDSASTAAGVSIQILYNNSPVSFNSDLSFKPTSTGVFNLSFASRYMQISNVKEGTVKAAATMEITYK